MQPKVLLIDNSDSFTDNLVELLRVCGIKDMLVLKNDQVDIETAKQYPKIIFSPGPSLPKDAPIMFEILEKLGKTHSILGVCLGHQAIAEYFGGELFNLKKVVHGIRKTIHILEYDRGIFAEFPATAEVGLYHSWAVSKTNFPSSLHITAESDDGIIMALRHRTLDITGVQFHPESYMSGMGRQMLESWLF